MAILFGKNSPDDSVNESFKDEQDDVVIEPERLSAEEVDGEEEMEGDQPEKKIAKMRAELAVCRKEKQEYMDGWQRAKADYVNLLKRFETDAKTSELKGKVRAIETLLPTLDTLERAKEHGDIPEGFLAIARQLENAFAALGLVALGEVGEHFNPALHEALGQDAADSAE
ncbi:MAG: nucleotide exchange factor GrpE, partial [Erythrobacter sp. 34-65-8]